MYDLFHSFDSRVLLFSAAPLAGNHATSISNRHVSTCNRVKGTRKLESSEKLGWRIYTSGEKLESRLIRVKRIQG